MSLLPPHASPLERGLEGATARSGWIETPIASLWDPAVCPLPVLPWLAWGLSVDSWDSAWSEATKRDAVARSIEAHRRKGTRASVETVLARLDGLLTIVEWFEAQPVAAPHTFDVVLPVVTADGFAPGGMRASAAFAERIVREVAAVKPLREHFALAQALVARGSVGVLARMRLAAFRRADLAVAPTDTSLPWATFLQSEDGEPLEDDASAFIEDTP